MSPTDRDYRAALAAAHAGRIGEAVRRCHTVLAAVPEHPGALRLLAYARQRAGDPEGALALLRRAVEAAPAEGRIALELGHLLQATGRLAEAVDAYAEAARRRAGDPGTILALAAALNRLGRRADAMALCEPLAGRTGDGRARRLLTAILRSQAAEAAAAGSHEDAISALDRIVALGAAQASDFSNLGTALLEAERTAAAEEALRLAVRLEPTSPEIRGNLANLLLRGGRYAEAVSEYEAADRVDPDATARSYNFGHALAGAGRLAEAWAHLDRHWTAVRTRRLPVPEWDGTAPVDSLLLWSEHGIGDEVLSLGMAPDATARAGHLVVECDRRLLPALRRAMPEVEAVARGAALPPVSAHLPAGRLPRLFRPDLSAFPDRHRYLGADPRRVAGLSERYRRDRPGLVVGLAWRSTNAAFGRQKSIPLADWKPLFVRRAARWISLQHGDCAEEVAAAGGRVEVDPEVDPIADIDGLLAQIAATDLVVTASNSVAHFAGALGKPCWVLLPHGSGLLWHWLPPTGERSPWYPSLRLFRSTPGERWASVIGRAADALEALPA